LTRAYERTLQAIGDGGPHRWPSRRPCGLPRLLGHGRHQKTQIRFCYRGISTSSKKPTTTASAPTNFISVSHRLPSPPTHRVEKGHADAFQTFSLLWWGGIVWQYAKSTLFFSASPRERSSLPSCQSISGFPPEKDCIGNRPRAIRNRYPASPRKRLHLQQAMEMENEGVIRADVGNTRNYDSHDRFGRSPVFEGKKTGEKGGRQVARVCACRGTRNADQYHRT